MSLAPARAAIKLKAGLKFPARVLAAAGLAISRANGVYTFGLNFPGLVANAGIADPTKYTLAAYNVTTGAYEAVRSDYLPANDPTTRTPRGDGNYVILNTDRYVGLTAALTAPRTWTLPAASAVPGGRLLLVQDEVGGVSGANTLTLVPAGTDKINGATSYLLATARGGVELRSDGVGNWSARVLADGSIGTGKLADQAVTTPKLADAAVTNTKLTPMAAGTFKGNPTGAPASPTDMNAIAVMTALGLVGAVLEFTGPVAPTGTLLAYGQAVSRATYAALLAATTASVAFTSAVGSPTLTALSTDLTTLGLVGAKIEGVGIPAGATITAVTSTTLTLSANTTAAGAAVAGRIFPNGNGDGSTTFNVIDKRGRAAFGRDDMGGAAAGRVTSGISGVVGTALGAAGGDQRMQSHTHGVTDPGHSHGLHLAGVAGGGGSAVDGAGSGTNTSGSATGISIQSSGAGASQNMPPAAIVNFIVIAGA